MDPRDYRCASSDELAQRLCGAQPRGGDVILLHDPIPHAIDALPAFVEMTRSRGLDFATAGELARLPRFRKLRAATRASVDFGCRFLAAGGFVQLTEHVCI
jgi:hypothetical protein